MGVINSAAFWTLADWKVQLSVDSLKSAAINLNSLKSAVVDIDGLKIALTSISSVNIHNWTFSEKGFCA